MNWIKRKIHEYEAEKEAARTALRDPKNVFPAAKHTIIEAFVCGGIQYYEFDIKSGTDYPAMRGIDISLAYREISMACDFDFLKMYQKANQNVLHAQKFNGKSLVELNELNSLLAERLTYPFQPGLIWNLAGSVYFDKTENPYKYDKAYTKQKIEFWKKEQGIEDFFLSRHMLKLLPFLKDYKGLTQTYSETVEAINQLHLDKVWSKLSTEQKQISIKDLSPLFAMGTLQN